MPILVHFKAKNNDNSYFYKNSGLSFPWVPYYVKRACFNEKCNLNLKNTLMISVHVKLIEYLFSVQTNSFMQTLYM